MLIIGCDFHPGSGREVVLTLRHFVSWKGFDVADQGSWF